MIIDCDSCQARPLACSDCVVSVLLGPPAALDLDDGERVALGVLAGSGLVPPLRLVEPPSPGGPAASDGRAAPDEQAAPGGRQPQRGGGRRAVG